MLSKVFISISILLLSFGQLAAQNRQMPQMQRPDPSQRPASTEGSKTDDGTDQAGKKKRIGKGSIFLNDSTKNIYGPNTTLSISEEDLFFNRSNYQPLDTGIINLHRWGYVQRFNYLFQDLGNVGTALNPIYPVVRNFSGAESGFNAYKLFFETEWPKYFDTKSPYTKINVIWGGNGRAMTHIEFSRNINSRWNFGFNYRPILIDKQMQRKRKGDRHVMAHYYNFFMSYKSKNEKYLSLFNFARTNHRVFENGGVFLDSTDTDKRNDSYYDREAGPRMAAAETSQFLRNFHFFNQYSLSEAFQSYVKTDYTREANNFFNDFSKEDPKHSGLFDHWEKVKQDTLKAKDLMRLSTFQNEVGFKGRAAFLFYNAYYKLRSYSAYYNHSYPLPSIPPIGFDGSAFAKRLNFDEYLKAPSKLGYQGLEHYLGGRIAFDVDSLTRLSGQAEINQLGNYSIDAKFTSKWVDAMFIQSIARPGFLYQSYRGSHDFWSNNFKDIAGLKVEGFLKTPFKKFYISPGVTYSLLSNYVYFRKDDFAKYGKPFGGLDFPFEGEGVGQTVLPVQSKSVINVANPQLRLGVGLGKKVRLSGSVINNLILSDSEGAMKIPDWLATGQLAIQDIWFEKNLQVHIGFDVTYRSAYKAMGYDVAIQQYYVQNDIVVGPALIGDIFLNAKLKRGRFFIRYHNIGQMITKTGYLITPGYPGQRNILDFGFELLLFD